MTNRVYFNTDIWSKAISIHSMIFDIYTNIVMVANLIQDKTKYSANVCQLRIAEYVINAMMSIKKEILIQGAKADFVRLENYLKGKWTVWSTRTKFALEFVTYSLKMNMVFYF